MCVGPSLVGKSPRKTCHQTVRTKPEAEWPGKGTTSPPSASRASRKAGQGLSHRHLPTRPHRPQPPQHHRDAAASSPASAVTGLPGAQSHLPRQLRRQRWSLRWWENTPGAGREAASRGPSEPATDAAAAAVPRPRGANPHTRLTVRPATREAQAGSEAGERLSPETAPAKSSRWRQPKHHDARALTGPKQWQHRLDWLFVMCSPIGSPREVLIGSPCCWYRKFPQDGKLISNSCSSFASSLLSVLFTFKTHLFMAFLCLCPTYLVNWLG